MTRPGVIQRSEASDTKEERGPCDPTDNLTPLEMLADEPRRSERVKREKPDYYDASEYENKRIRASNTSSNAKEEPKQVGSQSNEFGQ